MVETGVLWSGCTTTCVSTCLWRDTGVSTLCVLILPQLSLPAQAAALECHEPGLSQQLFIPQGSRLEARALAPAAWGHLLTMSSRGCCLAHLQRPFLSLTSHKDANPIVGAPSSRPDLTQIASQRPHLLTPLHWGLGLQQMNLGRTQTFGPQQQFTRCREACGIVPPSPVDGDTEATE